MSETIRGKGVISGIAVGTVMLAGQNLDGYLAAYHPGTLAEEESKAEAAIAAVTETLLTTIER
ncbi:MAG: phosphoenolpyruvate--protein phosphotransferase, partial [Selenomonas noxia]